MTEEITVRKLVGMDPRLSIKIYPRLDEKYRLKGSLNFDLLRTKVFKEQEEPRQMILLTYAIYSLIAVGTGLSTVLITGAENEASKFKAKVTDEIIGGMGNNMIWGWVFFTCISTALAFLGGALVVYVAPQAAHSGTVGLQAYLNGVNNYQWFGLRTFLVKSISTVLVGVSGLCVGKTGTFAHFGAMVGMGVLYLPIKDIDYFHIDSRKREFVAAGLSCGMAVAFGAPIGGTLFGYEISQPNTYWQFTSMWRTFLTCTLGVVVYSFCIDLWTLGGTYGWVLNSSPMRFDSVTFSMPTIEAIPTALIIGAGCGLLGSAFVAGNTYVNMFRKVYYDSPIKKCMEVTILAFITSSFFYWLPYVTAAKCYSGSDTNYADGVHLAQYNCPNGFYNPLATLFFNTEGLVIRAMVGAYHQELEYEHLMGTLSICVFAMSWFFFSMLTYGSHVPSGVFLSAILVGCSIGFLFENFRVSVLGINQHEISTMPIIIGAAAMMSGYTRWTYSIVVVMLEASDSFNLAVPMLCAVWTCNVVGNLLTTSLFERELRGKQMPFLRGTCPKENARIPAGDFMSKGRLITVQTISDMKSITRALSSTHNAFPVLNTAGNLVGVLPKSILKVLVEQK